MLPARTPDFFLFSSPDGGTVQARSPIVVLCPESSGALQLRLPPDSILVLDGRDRFAVSYAARHSLRVLDCGLSSRDTLTLSSFSDGNAIACLQRPVEDLEGRIVEPFEFPLCTGKLHPPFPLLCCAAVLILSGRWGALLSADHPSALPGTHRIKAEKRPPVS